MRRAHAHVALAIYIRDGSVKICRFKTFWVRIFAPRTLLSFRYFSIHVKLCVLMTYSAIK